MLMVHIDTIGGLFHILKPKVTKFEHERKKFNLNDQRQVS
ncbi:hypothetical protein BDW_04685 [Bdellovibrio bacteriovorus W]|nr:hypothetical protein BDW_04685 [Bdellovibrio bacteriovorus W]